MIYQNHIGFAAGKQGVISDKDESQASVFEKISCGTQT